MKQNQLIRKKYTERQKKEQFEIADHIFYKKFKKHAK